MSDPFDKNAGEKADGRIEPSLEPRAEAQTPQMPDSAPPAAEDPAAPSVSELDELRAQLEAATARASAAEDARLRSVAELDNVRKRTEREIGNSLKFATERLLGELLTVCDSLELGLKAAGSAGEAARSLIEGMELTHKQLVSVLEKHGVSAVDPQGQPFSPESQEAVSMVESSDVAPNHVLSVMQKGYKLHERVLRPAMVVVARAPTQPQA